MRGPAAAARLRRRNPCQEKGMRSEQTLESAGTGYGHEEYDPSMIVAFDPEKRAVEKIYLKYEWRSTLCRLGVVACICAAPASPQPSLGRLRVRPVSTGERQTLMEGERQRE